jgi:hypothetical protein
MIAGCGGRGMKRDRDSAVVKPESGVASRFGLMFDKSTSEQTDSSIWQEMLLNQSRTFRTVYG